MLDLDAIEAALEKMTPEDWEYERDGDGVAMGWVSVNQIPLFTVRGDSAEQEDNAEGIVILRNSAPEMIAEIRRLRELCGEAADNLRDAYDAYRPFYLGEIKDRLQAASKGEL